MRIKIPSWPRRWRATSTPTTRSWRGRLLIACAGSSRRWPNSTWRSRRRARRGPTRSSCCRRSPVSARRSRRRSSPKPVATCRSFPAPPTSHRGPGWRWRSMNRPASAPRPVAGVATSGSTRCWWRQLGQSAGCTGKNYLAVQHARLTRRRGMSRAQVAVAHSMLSAAYYMLKRDEPYDDLGPAGSRSATRSPHPPARHSTGEARPHRRPRPGQLSCWTTASSGSARRRWTRARVQVIHGSVWLGRVFRGGGGEASG